MARGKPIPGAHLDYWDKRRTYSVTEWSWNSESLKKCRRVLDGYETFQTPDAALKRAAEMGISDGLILVEETSVLRWCPGRWHVHEHGERYYEEGSWNTEYAEPDRRVLKLRNGRWEEVDLSQGDNNA